MVLLFEPWALPSRAQPAWACSMHLLGASKGSADGGEREVVHGLIPQIFRLAALSHVRPLFTCLDERKGVWESLEQTCCIN